MNISRQGSYGTVVAKNNQTTSNGKKTKLLATHITTIVRKFSDDCL